MASTSRPPGPGEPPAARLLRRAREAWARFWHVPLRAERLGLMRILLGLALLTDQLCDVLPHLEELYGASGVAPAGLYDDFQARYWRWTVLFFNGDDPSALYPAFGAWVAVTAAFTLGWHTRLMNAAAWLLTLCFFNRNPIFLNGGDFLLQNGLLLLLLGPSGRALSLDAWLRRHREPGAPAPAWTPAWPVRLIQVQLCLVYLSTGLIKLQGEGPFRGTWWEGTSVHYALNDLTLSRWSFAQLPLPLWVTAPLTYVAVWWEVLFTPLVLCRRTRPWTLWFGVLLHLGIWLALEVGWFTFYTWAFYGAWVPCPFWARLDAWRARSPAPVDPHPAGSRGVGQPPASP